MILANYVTSRHHRDLGRDLGRELGLAGAAFVMALLAGAAPARAADAAHEAWRATIEQTPTAAEGCFRASYPSTRWSQVACKQAPARPFLPRRGRLGRTVGDGDDYAAGSAGLTSQATGAFPKVTGVTSETGLAGANDYSLQLNSNFMLTAACGGSGNANCIGWLQYVYSSGYQVAFMQYWLINYGSPCPKGGWMAYGGDCYKNSAAVSAPQVAITGLSKLKMTGKAVSGGNDFLTFTSDGEAYRTSGKDSVVYLAAAWNASEFNIIGDGDGSAANFNSGSSVTVQISLLDGSTAPPTCEVNAGTTAETNNLNLKNCAVAGGTKPSIKFVESN